MSYPTTNTLLNLSQRNLDWQIKWPAYLGQTLAILPFVRFTQATEQFESNEATSLATLSPYSRGSSLGLVPVDTTKINEPFQRFGDHLILDYFDGISARGVDLFEQQIQSVKVRILRELSNQIFNGSGVSPNLSSLFIRADTIVTVGGPLTLAALYQIRYGVKPSTGEGLGWGGNAWFSHSKVLRALEILLGGDIGKLCWKKDKALGVEIPYYLGMPWYVDDTIAITGSNLTRVYLVNLDHIQILYSDSEEYPADSKGIQVIPIPMQANISELGYAVSGVYALQNDPGAVAALRNVNVSGL
jgi:hypothetical protein